LAGGFGNIAEGKPIRVLIAKFELESHDRGARVVAKMLADAGMEVIYCVFRSTGEILKMAIEEDVDVIGLSALSGDTHNVFLSELMELLKAHKMDNIVVIAGGRIPDEDVPGLLKIGVRQIFGPGSLRDEIVDYIRESVAERSA
jgi:methylmalonyl-CoA mutase C-terminal domain/subunit